MTFLLIYLKVYLTNYVWCIDVCVMLFSRQSGNKLGAKQTFVFLLISGRRGRLNFEI